MRFQKSQNNEQIRHALRDESLKENLKPIIFNELTWTHL